MTNPTTDHGGRCWVFSAYISAWSLRAGLTQVGRSLHVCAPDGLVRGGNQRPASGDTLFFTEEASLVHYLAQAAAFQFLPRHLPDESRDNKPGLTRCAAALGVPVVASWPLDAMRSGAGPAFPLLLKGVGSWRAGRRLPRGWICADRASLDRALQTIVETGFAASDFFLQEWFGDAAPNYSVCGFFDSRRPARDLLVVVRRRVNDRPSLACSAVVEVVDDPGCLVPLTRRVLGAIDYTGPFELEFLQDGAGQFRLLELNARWWMQHGLFLPFGNGVLRRYLGLDATATAAETIPLGTTWVNGVWLTQQILHGRWRRALRWIPCRRGSPPRLVAPNLGAAFRFVIRRRLIRAGAANPAPGDL